jgi:hypothetical protein
MIIRRAYLTIARLETIGRGVLTNRNEEHMGSTTIGDAAPSIGIATPSEIECDRGSRRVSPVACT